MKIGNKEIGNKQIYIIAEAGINHNGDISLAKKLIDAAAEAGADAVKFQTFKAELIVTETAYQAEYQKKSAKDKSQFAMLKKLELTEEDFSELKEYCDKKRIEFLSTPHSDTWSVDFLEKLGIVAYKMGSGDITNIPILKYTARLQKPIILSTGMSSVDEIKESLDAIKENNDQIILLQCTTMYPCPNNKANINYMIDIKKFGFLVGYSDHTLGIEATLIAACLGSVLIEKHFTLDKNMEGPDHQASLDPSELKLMVKAIRHTKKNNITDPYLAFEKLNSELGCNLDKFLIKDLLGKKQKKPEPEEIEIAKVARKSIIAIKDISENEELSEKNIGIRRPGEGLAPKYYYEILGKKIKKKIAKNNYIVFEDLL